MHRVLTFVALIASAACSHRNLLSGTTTCEPVTGEVSSAAGMNVYRDCEVDARAVQPRDDRAVSFTPAQKGKLGCFRASLEFAVDTAGVPVRRTIKILSSNDQNFASAVSGHVMALRWKPAMLGGLPVGQMVRYDKVDALIAPPSGSSTALVHGPTGKC